MLLLFVSYIETLVIFTEAYFLYSVWYQTLSFKSSLPNLASDIKRIKLDLLISTPLETIRNTKPMSSNAFRGMEVN